MADIISIGTLSKAKLTELSEAGIDVKENINLDELKLPEPSHGEDFAFHMEPEETAIFVEMHSAAKQWEKWSRELFGQMMISAGKQVSESDLDKPWFDELREGGLIPEFETPEKEEDFYRLYQRKHFLHTLLYWKLGERGGLHSFRLGIRRPSYGEDRLRVFKVDRRQDLDFGKQGE